MYPDGLVEVTCRTVQGRPLMRPGSELNRRLLGIVGRAQRRESMIIHAIVFLSTHYHMLLSPHGTDQLVRFMRYVQSNVAKEVGDLVGWQGSIWDRRYTSIPVAPEDEDQIDRLRYLLENSVKEDLVASPLDWPGVHSAAALLGEGELEGIWYNRSKLYELSRRGAKVRLDDVAEPETVVLSPLPCWQDLPATEVREQVAGLVESIETQHAERRAVEGVRVLGARAVCRQNPTKRTGRLETSPAPRFHAKQPKAWNQLRDAYEAFAEQFRLAARELLAGRTDAEFPPGSFPPGLPYVPHQAPG